MGQLKLGNGIISKKDLIFAPFLAFLSLLPLGTTSGISNKLASLLNLEINVTPELIQFRY